MKVTSGSEETSLSVGRWWWMEVPPNEALDMSGSLHLTISYLLKDKQKDLESKSYGWLIKLKG